MEYTNEVLQDIKRQKLMYNHQYSNWYISTAKRAKAGEIKRDCDYKIYEKKAYRIKNCLNVWVWDKYEKNKILDLQTVNRCMNNRFCPNCRLMDISKFIHKFKKVLNTHMLEGYVPYMLTLTFPNVKGEELEDTIKNMTKNFNTLIRRYRADSKKKHSVNFAGGIRVLEITHNSSTKMYHPHYHALVMVKGSVPDELMEKTIQGRYSKKRKSYNMKSVLDLEISKYWTLIYNNINCSKKNYDALQESDLYECDFRELDEKGFYEIFKYTFKDIDVPNQQVFQTIEFALTGRRIRQGFGILYNLKCEGIDDEGELQELTLLFPEEPEKLYTKEIDELYTTYNEYKKISRFNPETDENIK